MMFGVGQRPLPHAESNLVENLNDQQLSFVSTLSTNHEVFEINTHVYIVCRRMISSRDYFVYVSASLFPFLRLVNLFLDIYRCRA